MSSSPSPSTSGPRPTETSIRSASTVSPSPKWTVSAPPDSSTFLHCFSSWSVIPRLPNCLASSLAASASSCGIRLGSISTIVTSEPKRLKIEANSQPMMPPPRTTSRRGTSVCARSPVESTQSAESSPSIGGRIGNEPVAMIADLKVTSSPPSTAIVFASLNRPLPLTHSTPFALNSVATPWVIWCDDGGLPLVRLREVELRLVHIDAELGEALLGRLEEERGLHPGLGRDTATRRQVPPSSGSFSMQTVLAPSCAARIAAV